MVLIARGLIGMLAIFRRWRSFFRPKTILIRPTTHSRLYQLQFEYERLQSKPSSPSRNHSLKHLQQEIMVLEQQTGR